MSIFCGVEYGAFNSLTDPFPIKGVSGLFLFTCFVDISEFIAKRVDPDQAPRSVTCDLGLHFCQCPF